jgi:NAD+ synthase
MKNKIINWIREQIKQAEVRGIVLGLSGGVDSCVTAFLVRQALGKNRVLGLILPCHSQRSDLNDAKLFARKFGIKTKTIDISAIYDSLIRILPSADRLSAVNIQPRLRMLVLYYFARKLNYLVCGTSNKSEIMTGYFTKFGDGASDILPLGDLLKTQVRKLARDLKIPERIVKKPPSAGLWLGQTDEDEMGIAYPELDDILERLDKKKKQVLPKIKVDKVKRMIHNSEHKRQGPKVCYISGGW